MDCQDKVRWAVRYVRIAESNCTMRFLRPSLTLKSIGVYMMLLVIGGPTP